MAIRNTATWAVGAFALCMAGGAFAQNAPFTIRKPLEGASVREKVQVIIPRQSISKDGFVAFFIDDKFVVAQAPQQSMKVPFTYTWDTKATNVTDGEHTLKATLFEPDQSGLKEAGSTEVRVKVTNKIKNGPTSLLLRYKYREGESLEYNRSSSTKLKGGELEGATGTGDQELSSVRSSLVLGIEDARPQEDVTLVRNKLTSLRVLTNGQEVTATDSQLSESMYQELDSRGRVLYETGSMTGFAQFNDNGLPVNNTLELPLMPITPVGIGEKWSSLNQRLDIPGVPPALQPRVLLENKLEGLEWENNRPTAKIVQTYEDTLPTSVTIGGMTVTNPTIKYERAIYLAYQSGVVARISRSLTIKGRTSDLPSASAPAAGGMAGMMRGGMPGMGGMPGGAGGMPPGAMAGMMRGAMSGMGGTGGMPGGPGGMPPGAMAGMMRGAMSGMGGQRGGNRGGQRGGMPGMPGMGGQRGQRGGMPGMGGMPQAGGKQGGGGMGAFGMSGGGMPQMGGAARTGGGFASQEKDRAVTIESSFNTELTKVTLIKR